MRITNQILAEYFDLDQQIKALESRKAALRDEFVAQGTLSTTDWVLSVSSSQAEGMISKADAEKLHGRLFLERNDLLKVTERTIVKVSKKAG